MAAFSPAAQQSSTPQLSPTSLVILDPGIADLALLRSGILPTATVHILDAQRDGIAQITELLQDRAYKTIHLVSHGAPGCLYLGNTELSLSTFAQYALQLTTWNLAETDLLLYGCNLALGDAGEEFLTKLHRLTGAKLHAAAQPVGNPALGGTWTLMPQQLNAEAPAEKPLPLALGDFILSRYLGLFGLGRLDTSFGNNGIVTTDFFNGYDTAEGFAVDSQGRIVVAGFAGLEQVSAEQPPRLFALARYLETGELDESFGEAGKVTTGLEGGSDEGRAMVIDGNGNIVVAGRIQREDGSFDLGVMRYDETGALDDSFGAGGIVTVDVAGADDEAWGMTLDASGNILLAGGSAADETSDLSLVRILSSGALDDSFGINGRVTTDVSGDRDIGYNLLTDATGSITLVGRATNAETDVDFVLARYSDRGELDSSFGDGGLVVTDFFGRHDYPYEMAMDDQGNVLVVGRVYNRSTNWDVAVVRYTPSGQLDLTFGEGGKVVLDLTGRGDRGYSLLLDDAGNIIIGGSADRSLALLRLTPDGALDLDFGTGGKTLVDTPASPELGLNLAFDNQGRLLMSGLAFDRNTGTNYDFQLVRYSLSSEDQVGLVAVTPATNIPVGQSGTDWVIEFADDLLPSTVNQQTVKIWGSQSGWLEATISPSGGNITVVLATNAVPFPGEKLEIIVTPEVTNQEDVPVAPTTLRFSVEVAAESAGIFRHVQAIGEAFNTQEAALGDFDGDGDLDAVLANESQVTELLINDGNGQFSQSDFEFFGLRRRSQGIEAGDVNGDGLLDFIVANNYASNELWLNQGEGIFDLVSLENSNRRIQSVRLSDLDGDGDLDLFSTGLDYNQIFHNDGTGQFSRAQEFRSGQSTWETRLGDFDGDGDTDAWLVGSIGVDGPSNQLWLNDGYGLFFNSGQTLGNSLSLGLDVGDLDGDGDLDAYVANRLQPDRVWLNDGQGNFTDSGQLLSEAEAHGISLGDFDGDGDLDAFVNNFGANEIWLNDGNAQFTLGQHGLGTALGNEVAIGDLDGDGDLDALATNKDGPNQVLLNDDTVFVTDVSLDAIAEDAATGGQRISDFMQPALASQMPGASLSYVAVTANRAGAAGDWQFSPDGVNGWEPILGSVRETAAELIEATAFLRFVPAPDFSGAAPALQLRAVDSSYDGSTAGRVDVTQNGLGTAIAAELTSVNVAVTPVNDAPQLLTEPSLAVSLAPVSDHALAPEGAVGSLISAIVTPAGSATAGGNVQDIDSAELGIALTGVDRRHGNWFYRLDAEATWLSLPEVTATSALLLAADGQTRLYFQPIAGFNGTLSEAITFRAWDRSSGEAGSSADVSLNGGSTAFSAEAGHASLLVELVNDAPQIEAQTFTVEENAQAGTVVGVVQATDPETPDALTFEIVEGNDAGWFAIAPNGSLSLTADAQLDYEAEARFELTVRVQESTGEQPLSETATITVDLLDQAEGQDFNQDGKADLLWQNQESGALAYWSLQEVSSEPTAIAAAGFLQVGNQAGWSVVDSVDFDGDGDRDILMRNYNTFQNKLVLMDGIAAVEEVPIGDNFPIQNSDWRMKVAGNFDQDDEIEILWRHRRTGGFVLWDLEGQDASADFINMSAIGLGGGALPDLNWEMRAAADFDGDGKDEVVWRNNQTGANALWVLDGPLLQSASFLPRLSSPEWQVMDAQDFDGDGQIDLAWRQGSTGLNAIWSLASDGNDFVVQDSAFIPALAAPGWTLV